MKELEMSNVNTQQDDICTETDTLEPPDVKKADKLPQIMATVAGMIILTVSTCYVSVMGEYDCLLRCYAV
jgi:hypothetical protein